MNVLQKLAGADTETLQQFPTEGKRFTGMGSAIVLTGAFAFVAGTVFLHDFLHAPWILALLMGFGWGVGVMGLDRWMLVSTRRQRTRWGTVLTSLPRLLLSLLIGLVIAEPVVLRVFQTEVAQQAGELKEKEYKADLKAIESQYSDIGQLEGEQTRLQNSLVPDTGAALERDTRYQALSSRNDELTEQLADKRKDRECHLAKKCKTTPAALNSVHQQVVVLRREVGETRRAMQRLRADLLAAEKSVFKQKSVVANQRIELLRAELAERRRQRDAAIVKAKVGYDADLGLMDRVEALHSLNGDRAGTAFFTWVLRFFILFVDLVPILFKTAGLLGRPSAAELEEEDREARKLEELSAERQRRLDAQRQAAEDRAAHDRKLREHERRAEELKAELAVLQAASKQRLVAEKTEELQRQILAAQAEVASAVIQGWSKEAMASIPKLVDAYTNPGGPGTPHAGASNAPHASSGPAHASNGGTRGSGSQGGHTPAPTPAPPRSAPAPTANDLEFVTMHSAGAPRRPASSNGSSDGSSQPPPAPPARTVSSATDRGETLSDGSATGLFDQEVAPPSPWKHWQPDVPRDLGDDLGPDDRRVP